MFRLRKLRFVLPIMFAFVILLASSSPVFAQPPPTCNISVEPQTTVVTVGDQFSVEIWIKDLSHTMNAFSFIVTWDRSQLQKMSEVVTPGWSNSYITGETDGLGYFALSASTTVNPTSWSASWATITFKCLAPGQALIDLPAQVTDKDGQTIYYRGVWSDAVAFDVTVWPGAAKQQPRPPPSNPTGHVGGQVFSANKLAVLSPYLALIGVVAVVAIVAKRKFA